MCSISGASFAPGSKINRHKLASALLREGEVRGTDASGFASINDEGMIVYKRPLPGGRLHVGRLQADASAMILHTRAATHGHESVNENNHPVISPKGTITLVHNGVIWNHDEVRDVMGKDYSKQLPEVDTSVIAAVIEEYGIGSTDLLEGDAAAAWFDTETGDTIHLAKFSHSTVSFATLEDGTFVFASTDRILFNALNKLGLRWVGSFRAYPDAFDEMRESEYYQVMQGEVISESNVVWGDRWSYSSSKKTTNWRDTTSGANVGSANKGSENAPMALIEDPGKVGNTNVFGITTRAQLGLPSEPNVVFGLGDSERDIFLTDEDYDEWCKSQHIPEHAYSDEYQSQFYEGDNSDDPDFDQPFDIPVDDSLVEFYTYDHDGNFVTYRSINGALIALAWEAGVSGGTELTDEEGEARWINHFRDFGFLDNENDELSFIKNAEAYQAFSPLLPTWVIDGIGKLRSMVGA